MLAGLVAPRKKWKWCSHRATALLTVNTDQKLKDVPWQQHHDALITSCPPLSWSLLADTKPPLSSPDPILRQEFTGSSLLPFPSGLTQEAGIVLFHHFPLWQDLCFFLLSSCINLEMPPAKSGRKMVVWTNKVAFFLRIHECQARQSGDAPTVWQGH